MPVLQLHGRARTVTAPSDANPRLSARARAEYQAGDPTLSDAVYGADLLAQHHTCVARLSALHYRDALGAQHAAVATLTGSASAARVASPPDGVAPLLTAGRSVRGPGLLG